MNGNEGKDRFETIAEDILAKVHGIYPPEPKVVKHVAPVEARTSILDVPLDWQDKPH